MEANESLSAPRVVRSIKAARDEVGAARERGATTGLVPTMGSFHDGHMSLMRTARAECDFVAVSIFINPAQFAPGEDLDTYPRNETRDLALASEVDIDLVFIPEVEEMYPEDNVVTIDPGSATTGLCADSRPGHFRGVLTVVAKLFNILKSDFAYFGQKDAQQAAAIKRMSSDLDFPVSVRVLPTVRESDGLAMSSRNVYLTQEERVRATAVYEALIAARQAAGTGMKSVSEIKEIIAGVLAAQSGIDTEYVEVVDAATMQTQAFINARSMALAAVRIGKARLIDNIYLFEQEPSCAEC